MRKFVIATLAAFAIAVVFLAGDTQAVRGNGVPQLVKLTYLEGVSNFGPQSAEGVLEFSFAEAYARVDVKNLPPLDGYTFEGWLLGTGTPFRVGEIPVTSDGIGMLDTKLQGLASYDYNLFVVSARKLETDEGRPPETSIGGRFTIIGDESGASAAGDVRPAMLPETGEKPGMTTRERAGRTITIAAATGGLAFVALRILNRRKVEK